MFEPAYLKLYREGVLQERAREAVERLRECRLCPRECGVNRLEDERGVCAVGRHAIVSGAHAHFGEEAARRDRGSGTVFFSSCNLQCSSARTTRSATTRRRGGDAGELSGVMFRVRELGCHNINLVTPTHVVPQVLEALESAVEDGFDLPLVYNTGGYDSLETLRLLDGVVDIYMPDVKFWDDSAAGGSPARRTTASVAAPPFARCTGRWGIWSYRRRHGGEGTARAAPRHAGGLAGTKGVMRFLAREISRDTYVNVMAQYRPCCKAKGRRDKPEDHPQGIRTGPGRGTSGGTVQAG